MGMAASQGRLLMMTARLSNNEFEQQCVAYSKQRLADDSLDANDRYLDAMNATKYQIITGYNGTNATFENVTYNQLTGFNHVAVGKQYIVSDNQGRIVVSDKLAQAFEGGNGDYNKFLAKMGITQCDIDITDKENAEQLIHEAWDKYLVSVYDGKNDRPDIEHISSFNYEGFSDELFDGYATYKIDKFKINENDESEEGFPVSKAYKNDLPYYYIERYEVQPVKVYDENNEEVLDENGNPKFECVYQDSKGIYHTLKNVDVTYSEEDNRFTYAFKDKNGTDVTATSNLTTLYVNRDAMDPDSPQIYTTKQEKVNVQDDGTYKSEEGRDLALSSTVQAIFYDGATDEQRNLYDYALSLTEAFYHSPDNELNNDANMQVYYKNIYNQMTTRGYTTYNRMIKEGYMNATETDERVAFADDQWLITQLKQGKLTISYYSAVDKEFIKTTLDDDESITEKEDKAKIKLAEQVYNTSMDRIEKEDKMFDLKLNKLESEHSALQTEYESVAKVISKNVEKSFSTFNA